MNLIALLAAWVTVFDTIAKEREMLERPEQDVYGSMEQGTAASVVVCTLCLTSYITVCVTLLLDPVRDLTSWHLSPLRAHVCHVNARKVISRHFLCSIPARKSVSELALAIRDIAHATDLPCAPPSAYLPGSGTNAGPHDGVVQPAA